MKKHRTDQQSLEISDTEAFKDAFNEYYPIVYNHINRMMRNHPDPAVDADDIVSETFIRAFRMREKIQNPEKLLRWLLKTARNLLIDQIRALNRQKYLSTESINELLDSGSDASFASMLGKKIQSKSRQIGIGYSNSCVFFRIKTERS